MWDNTHNCSSALDRHFTSKEPLPNIYVNYRILQNPTWKTLYLWLHEKEICCYSTFTFPVWIPGMWDPSIIMSWHQVTHNLITKFHLILDGVDSDSKKEIPKRTRGPQGPWSSNYLVTWGEKKYFNHICPTIARPDGFKMCPENFGYTSLCKTHPNIHKYVGHYCVISLLCTCLLVVPCT